MTLPRTWIVCEDAGAAASLVPVAAKLREGGALAGVLAGSAAAPAFGESARVVTALSAAEVEAVFAGCERLLTGSTPWGLRLEARSVLAARARGTKIVTFVDYWANYAERLSYPSAAGLELVPDAVAVVDARMREELVAIGVERARITVTGAPAFDALWARRGTLGPPSPDEVLFVSQPLEALYGTALGYTEKTVLAALAPELARRRLALLVRPHPREDRVALEGVVARLPGVARVSGEGSLLEAIGRARVVVGMTTMALVEAALAGRPTVSVQIGARQPLELPTVRAGVTRAVMRDEDLAPTLSAALADTGAPWRTPPTDEGLSPGAADRVLALLAALR